MVMAKKIKAKFIEPMLLLRTDALPNDRERWQYELRWMGIAPSHSRPARESVVSITVPRCDCLHDGMFGCRTRAHRITPADPVLVGINTLQQWLWQRLQGGCPAYDAAQHVKVLSVFGETGTQSVRGNQQPAGGEAGMARSRKNTKARRADTGQGQRDYGTPDMREQLFSSNGAACSTTLPNGVSVGPHGSSTEMSAVSNRGEHR